MRLTVRNLLGISGVISALGGTVWTVSSVLGGRDLISMIASMFLVGGLIMLAIAFGDWDGNKTTQ